MVAATHDERFATDVARRRLEMAVGWVIADEGQGVPSGDPGEANEPFRVASA